MRKIKIVVLLVRQLQHGFTKNANVSPNLTVTHIMVFSYFNNYKRMPTTLVMAVLCRAYINLVFSFRGYVG